MDREQKLPPNHRHQGSKTSLGAKPEIERNPSGQLLGRGRNSGLSTIHAMRDSLIQIKRYLYRRICERHFPPLSAEVVSKADLRRYSTWLQPVMQDAPTKTEVYCFNSRPGQKDSPRVGTPVVLFPCAKRANKEFFNDNFSRLKERVLLERRIPVGLLALLSGKSSKEHRDSVGCLIHHKMNKDPYSLLRPPTGGVVRMALRQFSNRNQASFSTLGNGARMLTVETANRFSCLDIDID